MTYCLMAPSYYLKDIDQVMWHNIASLGYMELTGSGWRAKCLHLYSIFRNHTDVLNISYTYFVISESKFPIVALYITDIFIGLICEFHLLYIRRQKQWIKMCSPSLKPITANIFGMTNNDKNEISGSTRWLIHDGKGGQAVERKKWLRGQGPISVINYH